MCGLGQINYRVPIATHIKTLLVCRLGQIECLKTNINSMDFIGVNLEISFGRTLICGKKEGLWYSNKDIQFT